LTKPVQEDQLIATVTSLMEAAEERQTVLAPVRQN
jgi:hypothetical protein